MRGVIGTGPITPVAFRLRTNGQKYTAILQVAKGVDPDETRAADVIALIAEQFGVSPVDIQLLGQWAKRQMRETS